MSLYSNVLVSQLYAPAQLLAHVICFKRLRMVFCVDQIVRPEITTRAEKGMAESKSLILAMLTVARD